jgi:hypothetical protein
MRTYRLITGIAAFALGSAGAAAGFASSATAAAKSTTDLAITFLATPTSVPVTWSLVCDPAGGTHPDPVGACARLDAVSGDPFKPVPPGSNCPQIWDGPETARITGQWRGQPADASFNRANGCEIVRWNNLVPVIPAHK